MKKIKKFIKENKIPIIIISIATLLFTTLAILVITESSIHFDTQIHSYILNIRNEKLTSILNFITNFAGASFLLALCVILLIIIKNKKIPLYMLINLTCAFLTNETAKNIFKRSRPIGINLIEETGLSFPSGHSMVGLAFYGFIIYLIYKLISNKRKKQLFTIILSIIILLIGFSRIYLGVHYFTDVIGGFLLGIIYLTIYINIIKIESRDKR